jgi:hypothetical protein
MGCHRGLYGTVLCCRLSSKGDRGNKKGASGSPKKKIKNPCIPHILSIRTVSFRMYILSICWIPFHVFYQINTVYLCTGSSRVLFVHAISKTSQIPHKLCTGIYQISFSIFCLIYVEFHSAYYQYLPILYIKFQSAYLAKVPVPK